MVKREQTCHDCGVKEGQFHRPGCDMERCPFCHGQLMSCDCKYKKLGYHMDMNLPFSGLPEKIFKNGLPPEQVERWNAMVDHAGRIPHFLFPWICARCGELWPQEFSVSNEDWLFFVGPPHREKILCQSCYNKMKMLVCANDDPRIRKTRLAMMEKVNEENKRHQERVARMTRSQEIEKAIEEWKP